MFTAQQLVVSSLLLLAAFFLGRLSNSSASSSSIQQRLPQLFHASAGSGCGSFQQAGGATEPRPFYIPPAASEFRRLATSLTPVTDKVTATSIAVTHSTGHTYDTLYR
jgi:hypothetical protein